MGLQPSARDDGTVLHLTEAKQSFILDNIPERPVPSILRGFSAPVKLKAELSDEELALLLVHDSDGFNRWEAGQTYFLRVIQTMLERGAAPPDHFLKTYGDLLDRAADPQSDKALMARAISLPDVTRIGQEQAVIDPSAIYAVREALLNAIVDKFADKLAFLQKQNAPAKKFEITAEAMGRRALHNTAMLIAANKRTEADGERARGLYNATTNMTDRMAALSLACTLDGPVHAAIISDFYDTFRDYPLVVDKWFSAQAAAVRKNIGAVLRALRAHAEFNIRNPNRVRALYASFGMNNPVCFHAADGAGYDFLTDGICALNDINPQIAARLLTPLRDWRRYTPDRQAKMKACLQRIHDQPKLSPDVYEIVSKTLQS